MSATLTIRDVTPSGKTLHEWNLDFLTERITVRELIRSRVHQEVKDHNLHLAQAAAGDPNVQFRGLVQPSPDERRLNTPKPAGPRLIDWQRQFDVALEAFKRNGFLILVDDHQVERLDDEIELKAGTQVNFVKLVPLVGG